ncbi:nucleotidyl transferase AbiEii/AbiGii toxin family protein [bacterium]|nr:MAG: nucleotidyl transferase AbiEii/AbiGii toxin family protein [bacterium]
MAQSNQSPVMNDNYPNTFRALDETRTNGRNQIFEPALAHFPRAFRLADSATSHERLEWELIRSEVRAHLLHLVAQSRWKNHLVLRGSVLLHSWFGVAAREPQDLDWVFQPHTVKLGDPDCEACFAEITELIKNNPSTQNARILTEKIASDDIWTYERAQGRRLVFPYENAEGAGREIQMDIVWGEALPEPPVITSFPQRDGSSIELWAATPQLSLAWKLLWLATDMHAQGKDLYDAVLLAEHIHLPFALLRQVFDGDEWFSQREINPFTFSDSELSVDWDNFQLEFPWIEGTGKQWLNRLILALASTWSEAK